MRADLSSYRFSLRVREQGTVLAIGDGIAWLDGLPSAALNQLIVFEDERQTAGMVFHLSENRLGAIALDASDAIAAGTRVHLGAPALEVAVGDALLGRVVDPLCRPLDGREAPQCTSTRLADGAAPSISQRDFVHAPLHTGVSLVDTMLPIGLGQRQLIIGDRSLGKTSLALDTIVAQFSTDVLCVYVLIGKRRSDVIDIIGTLNRADAMQRCVVVVAEADAPPGLQYVAPYAACAVAEEWMWRGKHVVIVYDDLTRHAQAYRSLSLLLRRPPGREAYPGDVFFLHSRLLERSTALSPELGGGSLTALPIVETQEGEIAAYIPTNLISITDGQTYFNSKLFASGFLPAIDIAKSVSRVGGNAQHPAIRAEAGRMRLEYLQFLELESFARLGTRLEASTAAKIRRGTILREVLKQERLAARSIVFDLAWMIAYNDGLLDAVPLDGVSQTLALIEKRTGDDALDLTAPRSTWSERLRSWLTRIP